MNKEIVGFTAGNFDLLHPGYIITFEEAKRKKKLEIANKTFFKIILKLSLLVPLTDSGILIMNL